MNRLLMALATTFLLQLLGMTTGILAARLLGPEGRGLLAQIISWAVVLSALGSISLNEAIVYTSSKAKSVDEESRILAAALVIMSVASLITIIVGLTTAPFIQGDLNGRSQFALYAGIFLIPIWQFTYVLSPFQQANGTSLSWNLQRLLAPALNALLVFTVWLIGGTVTLTLFVLAQVLGVVGVLILSAGHLNRRGLKIVSPKKTDIKELVSYSLRAHSAAIGGQRENLDRLLIAAFVPAAALGEYAVAATIPAMLLAVALTCDMVIFPKIARITDAEQAKRLYVQAVRTGTIFMIAAGFGASCAATIALVPLFGEPYRNSISFAWILSGVYALIGTRFLIGSGFKAFDQPFRHGRGDLLALAITALVVPAGVAIAGTTGAALGVLVAQAAALALALMSIRSSFQVPLGELLVPRRSDFTMFAKTFFSLLPLARR